MTCFGRSQITITGCDLELASSPNAGDASFAVTSVPTGLEVGGVLVIDPFTDEMELRTVTVISDPIITVADGLTYAHDSGDAVFLHDGGLVPWTWAGGVPDDITAAAANVTAFNRIGTQILGLSVDFGASGIFVPAGNWWVNDELIIQHSHTIAGTSPDRSLIHATADFPFDGTGEVAVMHGTRAGSGNTSYANGGPLSRYYLRDFLVTGSGQTNSNGILVAMQQPAHWENVRVDSCLGLYGICVGGQHAMFNNLEMFGCATGLRLRGATIMSFEGLSIEGVTGNASVIIEDTDGGIACFQLDFGSVHLELNDETIGFDVSGGATGLSFRDFWYTNPDVGSGIKFDVPLVNPGIGCRYVIENYRCNNNTATFFMIDDVQRSLQLNSFADTDRMIMLMAAHTNTVRLAPAGWVET